MKKLLYYVLPLILFLTITCIAMILLGVWKEFFYWFFQYAFYFASNPSYGYSPGTWELKLIAPSFFPLVLMTIVFIQQKRIDKIAILTAVLGLLLIFTGSPRWAFHKAVPGVAFLGISLGYVLEKSKKYFAVICLLLVIGIMPSAKKYWDAQRSGFVDYFGPDYIIIGEMVAAYTHGEHYFVFGNYPYLYLYHDQKPIVLPWVPHFPWYLDVPGVQEHIVSSIKNSRVPYIIYLPYAPDVKFYGSYWPEKLGNYILSHYQEIAPLPGNGKLMKLL